MAIANKSESRNFSATSDINNTTVMYMNASYSSSGDLSFNESIRDMDAYKSNKATVDADYDEWKGYVMEQVGVTDAE